MKFIMKSHLVLSAIIICSALGASCNKKATTSENLLSENLPAHISSEKELRAKVFAAEWIPYSAGGKEFVIGRVPLLSAGSSRERIACWLNDTNLHEFVCVWDVRLHEIGPVKVEIDKNTSALSVTAIANTPFEGKVVASVILTTLGP